MVILTPKQKRFCEEYLIDMNATQAAIRAGYSEETAYSIGQRLLKNVEVETYIDDILEKISSERIATAQEVMEHLTSEMRGQIKEECVIVENTGDYISEGKIIEKTVTPKDRIKAAELLGRRYKLFTDNLNVSETKPPPIIYDIPKYEGEDDES